MRDRVSATTDCLKNCHTAHVANVEPYGLGWWPKKKCQLTKIRVLGDDDVVVLTGVLPNLAIRRLGETNIRNVGSIRKLTMQ